MKKSVLSSALCLLCCATMIATAGCASNQEETLVLINGNGEINTNGVIPERESLVENLEDAGYTITEYTSVGASDLIIDRLVAEKGNKFIDITYGLSDEDAVTIFDEYCNLYKEDGDYYILAQNLNFVYCVSDKKTFSTAGFTSTSNIGVQYIND